MVAALILAAVATATPTPMPSATPTARPTAGATTAPGPSGNSETYGKKVPLQLRPQTEGGLPPEPTPTLAANSLAGVAARIKLHREAMPGGRITRADIPGRAPVADEGVPGISTAPETFDMITAKERCANFYPQSLEDQVGCVKALRAIASRAPWRVPPEEFGKIRSYCIDRWPSKPDMQDYCEKNELEAWYRLHPEAR